MLNKTTDQTKVKFISRHLNKKESVDHPPLVEKLTVIFPLSLWLLYLRNFNQWNLIDIWRIPDQQTF